MKSPRRQSRLWDALALDAAEEAIERAASVSVEEAERELAAAGFDVAAERQKAEQVIRSLERGTRRR